MKYSVVVPVYNSSKSLKKLCQRIDSVFIKIDKKYEIILVDDCSQDNSWQIMQEIQKGNSNVKLIQLMRNFGQHNAILCGFNHVSGNYIITMDDDLQNPPEEIPKLIDKIHQGYDVVIGAIEKKKDTFFKNIASFFIRNLVAIIFNKPKELRLSSFRILTKALCDEIKQYKTPYPFIAGIILSMTKNVENVTVKHDMRRYGSSTYNIFKLIKLAFNLIINYTSLPLNTVAALGLVVSALSFLFGFYIIFKKLVIGVSVEGWTSVIVLLAFFNGVLITILSLLGEYMVRIIGEVSNRSQFVVRRKSF